MTTLGVLYTGEMGAAVARRLTASGHRVVTSANGRSPRTLEAAAASGVDVLPLLSGVVREAELVLCLVPQEAAVAAAREFAAATVAADARPVYLDANSLAPATLREIVGVVTASGCDCVDGAFIGNAASLGEKTVLCLSGPQASWAAGVFGEALAVRVLGEEVGIASAFKLSIYGFNKGLVALFLEMTAAADQLGLRQELIGCLRDFYPGSVETVERLLPTYPRHARRRTQEMTEVVEWLGEIGQSADMAAATRAVIQQVASLDLSHDGEWDAETLVAEMCRLGLLRARGDPSS
jgi:3-hydroxyisobutyrate dehydrogenase-like beta-hydroxyacid dehydrogenase